MKRLAALYRSSVGKKAIAAITGIILIAFIFIHAFGNLHVFRGVTAGGIPDIDIYAHFLKTMGEPILPEASMLWGMRIVLVIALIIHVWTVLELAYANRAARPVNYKHRRRLAGTFAATWMLWSGLLLFVFVIVHLANFTVGELTPFPFVEGAVYANLYHAFNLWYLALFYLLAVAALGLHLYHGAWSLFQTLGIDNPDRNPMLRRFALAAALVVSIAFGSIPVSFILGYMEAPPEAVGSAHSMRSED